MPLNTKTLEIAEKYNFDVQGYVFSAKLEELRKPRIVRVSSTIRCSLFLLSLCLTNRTNSKQIAAVQNSIVRPTTDPINVQRDAIHAKIQKMVEAAATAAVNIICFQEAWSKLLSKRSYIFSMNIH